MRPLILQSLTNSFHLREDGIIESKPRTDVKAMGTLKEAMADIECVKQLSCGRLYPSINWLPDATISKEARDYFANLTPQVIASALMIKSPFQRILGNFFLGFNRLNVPMKMFTEEPAAVDWLLEMKLKYDMIQLNPERITGIPQLNL